VRANHARRRLSPPAPRARRGVRGAAAARGSADQSIAERSGCWRKEWGTPPPTRRRTTERKYPRHRERSPRLSVRTGIVRGERACRARPGHDGQRGDAHSHVVYRRRRRRRRGRESSPTPPAHPDPSTARKLPGNPPRGRQASAWLISKQISSQLGSPPSPACPFDIDGGRRTADGGRGGERRTGSTRTHARTPTYNMYLKSYVGVECVSTYVGESEVDARTQACG